MSSSSGKERGMAADAAARGAAAASEASGASRLARLFRYASEAQLSETTRALVKGLLLRELGAGDDAPVAAAVLRPETAPEPQATRRTAAPERAAPAHAVPPPPSPRARAAASPAAASPAAEPRAPQASLARRPEQLELKIRQLVEADATWTQLEPLAWELFTTRTAPDTAARILELAFLHGSTAQLEATLVKLKNQGGGGTGGGARGFYPLVHAAVRAHIVARLWREGTGETLATLLYRDKDESYLQPIERLFVFHSMAGAKDTTTPYIYFRRFRREMLDAVADLGGHVGLAPARFLLHVGRMAFELGYDNDARELLEQIRPAEAEHDEALRLLLNVSVVKGKNGGGRSAYADQLLGQSALLERVRLLGQFLAATRGLGGFKDRNRPALNEILRNPLEWLADEPEAWATLSELLVANRDLEPLLPNLFEVFRINAGKFLTPLLDSALWQGPLAMNADTPRDQYWRGVALLHHYVNCGITAEKVLWQAREQVQAAKKAWRQPLPYDWRELHKLATAWVAKNHYQMEPDRARMLQQLRVALDPDAVAIVDIEEYLEHAEAAPVEVLAQLQRLAEAKNAPALECRLLLKRAQATHLTNDDLNRFWQLANVRQESDLAWRVATVLQSRRALMPQVRHAWEISGEKRSHYPFVPSSKLAVERCLKGFPPRAARLAFASLHVGAALPELLALLDPGASVTRATPPPPDSVEARAEKLLAGLSWLGTPKRRYRFSFEASVGNTNVPAFVQVLPSNPWSILVAKLAERLGVNAWGWKLSRLHTQIVDLIPRLASRQDLKRHSGKVAKWLKDLTPEQRAAWQDLATLSRSLDDERATDAMATFICRVATMIYQNHLMALSSLHAMRANVAVVWDLEQWILSDTYTELRRQLGTPTRVLVPNALQRVPTIVVPDYPDPTKERETEASWV